MKNLLKSLLVGLLCLVPAFGSGAGQRLAALVTPQTIAIDLGVVEVRNVGNLSTLGAPTGATFTLLTNPSNYFSIVGTEIVANPATPSGQYSITVQATGGGLARPIKKTFALNFTSAIPPPTPVFFQGANLSGLEDIPPSSPSVAEIGYFVSHNITNFRLPINWINIQPTVNTPLDPTFVTLLHQALANFVAAGGVATIDVHNFGNCPNGLPVGTGCSVSAFVDLWTRIATEFGHDAGLYGFDLMNEWVNGFPFPILLDAQQQAINAVRGLGFTGFIYAEGTNFTGAWNWVSGQGNPYNNSLLWQLVDPLGKLKFSAHMYYDRNNSGTHFSYGIESTVPGEAPPGTPTNPTIGVTRLSPWVQWGAQNNVTLNYGEGGVGSDSYSLGGSLNFLAWNVMLDNAIAVAKANKIEYWYWGAGSGFGQGFLGTAVGYGYNPEPFSPTDLSSKDFTATGVQAPQMAVLRRSAGSTQPQPIAYALARPLSVTSSGNPEAPIVAPVLYGTVGTPSPPFRVYYGGEIPAPVTITPHDTLMDGTPAGGTFTPGTLTLAAGENALGSFTYTPSQAATIQIATTNNVGWTDPPAVGFSSQTDNYADVTSTQLGPIYGAYNRFTPNIGPAYRIQRSSDGAQEDVYFTKLGSTGYLGLDRVAIQTWAAARSGITVVRQYDQSPKKSHITFNQVYSNHNPVSFTGQIVGTTLTVLNSGGALSAGLTIADDTLKIVPGTKLVSGGGSVWTVNISQNVPSERMIPIVTSGATACTLQLDNTAGYPEIVDPSSNSGICQPSFFGPFVGASQLSTLARYNQSAGANGVGMFRTDHITGPVYWSTSNIQFSRTGYIGQPPNLTISSLIATINLNTTNGTYGDYAWVYNVNSATGHKTYKNGSTTASQTSVLSSFTGTGSGTTLTTTSVTGSIQPTDTLYGSCVPAGTYVVSQTSGTTGGAGVYVTSQPTTCAADAVQSSYVMYPAFDDGTTQLGWFIFSGTFFQGSYTNLEFATTNYADAKVNAIMATDATYYSTPLPDVLPGIPPAVSNIVTGQPYFVGKYPSYPFSVSIVTDPNAGATDSISIALTGAAGTLSGSGISGTGPYTIASGTPAAVSAILRGVQFTPSTSTVGNTTTITATVTSSAGSSTTAVPTVVISTYVAETAFAAPVGTFTPVNFSGVNLSGGETLNSGIPNALFPQQYEMDYLASAGYGLIRLPFTSGYASGSTPGLINSNFGQLNTAFTSQIKAVLDYAFAHNLWVVLDLHDFGNIRYNPINGPAFFVPDSTGEYLVVDTWSRLATLFKNYPNAIFGPMNEPVATGVASELVTCVSATVAAIRAAGATQLVTLPGVGFTHGQDWVSSGNAAAYTGFSGDPLNNFVFEAHQYLDSGQQGQNPVATINGSTVLVAMNTWLAANSYKGVIYEFAITWDPWYPLPGNIANFDATMSTPLTTNSITQNGAMLNFMKTNSANWLGWAVWVGGAVSTPKINGGNFAQVLPQYNSSSNGFVMPLVHQPQEPTLLGNLL